MAEKMKFEIVTPYGKVVDTEIDEVTASGALGEFGVLPGHAPFLTSLKIGELCYKSESVSTCMALNWGYFEIKDNRIIILVETAEYGKDIDVERAKAAFARAEEALKAGSLEDKNMKLYEAALQRAVVRMSAASKTKPR